MKRKYKSDERTDPYSWELDPAVRVSLHRTLHDLVLDPRFQDLLHGAEPTTLYRLRVENVQVAVMLLPEPRSPLTEREQQVVSLLGRGLGNKGIAREMRITEETVRSHLKAIFAKWNLHSRAAVARCAAVLYG